MEPNEKRMAGDYEVIQSVEIGPREIIVCESKNLSPKYVCSFVEPFAGMELYPDAKGNDDYIEVMKDFIGRIGQAIEVLEQNKQTDINIIKPEQCEPCSDFDSLIGQVVVLRADTLKREYRSDRNQLYLASGGNGAYAGKIGNAVFGYNLDDKKQDRLERYNLMGVIKESEMPAWAKQALSELQTQLKQRDDMDAR